MSIFYVFQGKTFKEESEGEYVWSPKLNRNHRKNAGFTIMTHIKKDDFILHHFDCKVVAISIAKVDCYDTNQPSALYNANTSTEGYRIDTQYYLFDTPFMVDDYKDWLIKHYEKGSAFTSEGHGKQQYMCNLADSHAVFILEKCILLQKDETVKQCLKAALAEIIEKKNFEYDIFEKGKIDDLIENPTVIPNWTGIKEAQEITVSSGTGREIPKRDVNRAAAALKRANYICEFDSSDRIFLRRNGKGYTEPHHLIPISKYREYDYSLDVMENIVSLCSHCHNLLHYGRFVDKEPILEKLYAERKDALRSCGINISIKQLKTYYR